MHPIIRALALAVAFPAAAVASTITIDEQSPGTVWEGIVEGFPGFPGRVVPNPLSVVRRGQTLQLRSAMEFPLAVLDGIAPDAIVSATLTFNIDDVLSTLGPGTELSGQGAETILVHFYIGDGSALPNDFDRTQEMVTAVDTGSGAITDATLQQTGPVVLTVDARARLIQALSDGTEFLGVLWRVTDNPTGTSIDDGRGGSASGEPSNTVPGSRMPFLTIEVSEAAPANCGNGAVDTGEQCDDGNTGDGDCCSRLCALDVAGAPCSDGDACTAGDACTGAGACVAGGPRSCDDGSTCTSDACDPATGCVHTPINEGSPCDDHTVCTADEVCTIGQCVGRSVDGTCDDGDACTSNDVCAAGSCAGATVCGNGALETTCGEECDDGNPGSGDGCSAACRHDALLGGDGPKECLVRVALGKPVRDAGGAIAGEQSCTDGNPSCDADGESGSCGFVVGGCFGLADPRLPDCGPATGVTASVVLPNAAGARQNRRNLITALRAVSLPGCMLPVTVQVPVRRRGKKLQPGKATVVLTAKAPGLGRDRDTIRLVCRPAS